MIVLTIEIWPQGDEERKRPVAVGVVYNDDTGTLELGNYRCAFTTQGRKKPGRKIYTGRVEGFRRLDDDAWRLIRLALEDALSRPADNMDGDEALRHALSEMED